MFETLRKVCDVLFLMYCEGVVVYAWVEGADAQLSSHSDAKGCLVQGDILGSCHGAGERYSGTPTSAVKESYDHDSNLTSRPVIS